MTAARTILVLLLFAAFALAQKPPTRTVSASFSATGTYVASDGGAIAGLDATGTFSFMGSYQVRFIGTVTQISHSVCTFYFHIYTLNADPYASSPWGPWYLHASGGPQTCEVGDGPQNGTHVGIAHVIDGDIVPGFVTGGTMAFNLIGEDDQFTFNGSADLNLLTPPAQTAGPGGSGYPFVVAGPGGSGYPIVMNGANSGSVLVFDDDNAGASSTAEERAVAGPSSIQIPLPVQSAAATYTVSADCLNSAATCWIQIPSGSGAIAANSSAVVDANLTPQGLSPGVYSAIVAITITPTGAESSGGSAATINLPLTAIVGSGVSMLGLSETGLQFQALAGAATQSESISIFDLASGSLPFSVSPSEPAGASWLSVFPGATTVNATPVPAEIEANPTGLTPGTYFGRVDVSAPGALNSPLSVDVALSVLPASNDSTPQLSSTALTIVANGANAPAAQQVQLSTLSDQQDPLSMIVGTNDGANWLSVSPSSGMLTSAQPFNAAIAAQVNNLQPGVYQGSVVFQNTNDSSTYPVSVQLVVPHPAPCTPSQLLPIISNLSTSSNITAALPVRLQVQIVDDCGSPMKTGAVVVSFSSGEPAVTMQPSGAGNWVGTWFPRDIAGEVVDVAVSASSFAPLLSGSTTVTAVVSGNATAPVVSLAGVVSAAAPATHLPVAPGGLISIFGSNLATAQASASSLPLPTMLGDTQVLLGGKPLPLEFVSSGQINAVVPYGAPVDAIQQLIVIHNGIYSPPEILVVAQSGPAVFTQDQSGTGAGVIFVVKPDGTQFLNTATAPASAGDALVIYCTGLGAVNPPVPDGAAAPASPAAKTVNRVAINIGGKTATVSFAGLVPGYAGLYQVNVTVPPGIAPAAAVPLLVAVGDTSSSVVTLTVR